MKIPTQLIFDDDNEPVAAVVPYSLLQKCFSYHEDSDDQPFEVDFLIRHYSFTPVKAWRIYRKFTIADVAKALDISINYYRKIERGERHYPIYDKKIAELFHIPRELIEPERETIGIL